MRRARALWIQTARKTVPWVCMLAAAGATGAADLAPLDGPLGRAPRTPWTFIGLRDSAIPQTRFSVEEQSGQRVLRVEAQASYGNLLHPLDNLAAGRLSWRWRVDTPVAGADLRRRDGDDLALKVCALFDLPLDAVPFIERQGLRMARARTGQTLPAATLCYGWVPTSSPETVVPNVYSRRVRTLTLSHAPGIWRIEQRDLAADFLRAFGDEATSVPPLMGIAVGADTDNTQGHSLGYIADLQHAPSISR